MKNYAIVRPAFDRYILIGYENTTYFYETDNNHILKRLHDVRIVYPKISFKEYNAILEQECNAERFYIKTLDNHPTALVSLSGGDGNGNIQIGWSDMLLNFESDEDAILYCECALELKPAELYEEII